MGMECKPFYRDLTNDISALISFYVFGCLHKQRKVTYSFSFKLVSDQGTYSFSFKLVSDRMARSNFVKTAMDVTSHRKTLKLMNVVITLNVEI